MRSNFFSAAALIAVMAASHGAAADENTERLRKYLDEEKPARSAVQVDHERNRVSVESKSGVGFYAGGNVNSPSLDNPRGERRVEGGLQIRFKGKDGKEEDEGKAEDKTEGKAEEKK